MTLKDLRNIIDNHPIGVLVSVSLGVASVTSGAMGYVAREHFSIKEEKLQQEKDELEKQFEHARTDLTNQLVSIERRVGNNESFFDITTLATTSEKIRTLPPEYKAFAGGAFYVLVPSDTSWTYEQTTELGLMRKVLGRQEDEGFGGLQRLPVHLWRGSETFTPQLQSGPTSIQFNFFPFVAAQTGSIEEFRNAVGEFLENYATLESDSAEVQEELDSLLSELEAAPPNDVTTDTSAAETRGELVALLETVTQDDIAALILLGKLQSILVLPQLYENTTASIASVQKKGNVLYLQGRVTFRNVKLLGLSGRTNLYIDQELFFISDSDQLLTITVQVPSTDRRSSAYEWAGKWLASLKVPLGT